MEAAVLKMLFIGSLSTQFGKHVYVHKKYNWHQAQKHCRDHYTDLSPITTWGDETNLKKATIGKVTGNFWIGLYKNVTDWKWSGGTHATDIPWAPTQPDGNSLFVAVCWHSCTGLTGWHDVGMLKLPFFCLNMIVVENKMTWEEALGHCRGSHTTLTSLTSETDLLLAQKKIQQNHITDRVWIGLRYLGNRWQWMNGDPLVYQAWAEGGGQDHQCPIQNHCGALTKGGAWENWDCQDRFNFICI